MRCIWNIDKDNTDIKICRECGRKVITNKTNNPYALCKKYHSNIGIATINATNAAKRIIDDGLRFITKEEENKRLEICNNCDEGKTGKCAICFCTIIAKVKLKTEHCPLSKWPGDIEPNQIESDNSNG